MTSARGRPTDCGLQQAAVKGEETHMVHSLENSRPSKAV